MVERKTGQKLIQLFGLGLLLSATACDKEELPVSPFDRGNIQTVQVCTDPSYKLQVWFKLENMSIVSQNAKTTWDLGFETGADGWRIYLNGALSMLARNTGQTDFAAVTDTSGIGSGIPDRPSGNPDSTAIGNWTVDKPVYLLNLGYDENGNSLGYYKLQLLSVNASAYEFKFAPVPGGSTQTVTLPKNDNYNLVYYSLRNNLAVQPEPPKDAYDLVFTQYTYIFYEPFYQPYLVHGVLSNRSGVSVARTSAKPFSEITAADTLGLTFSHQLDAVGYNWKEYDFNTSTYILYPEIIYFVKDTQGFLYKMHFIDFYSDTGQRGCPKFEIQRL